jgi:hypothetical protein
MDLIFSGGRKSLDSGLLISIELLLIEAAHRNIVL